MIVTRDVASTLVVSLDRPPVNAMEPGLVAGLDEVLVDAAGRADVRSIVLTSANPKLFSAGLDLKALEALDRDGFSAFARDLVGLCRRLVSLPKPVMAALPGHAIAGGYLLAASCDRVLMAEGKGRVGLPEATLGVPVPPAALEIVRARLGDRVLAEVALLAEQIPADRALALGMVDRLLPAEELLDAAIAEAKRMADHAGDGFAASKLALRRASLAAFDTVAVEGQQLFVDAWMSEAAAAARHVLLDALKKG